VSMLRCDDLQSVLVLAAHADDEAVGCAGLMAKLTGRGCRMHVVYLAVDGFHHYGIDRETTYAERVAELTAVNDLLGCTSQVVYGDEDLIEKLDTLPRRALVDLFEQQINAHRPDLLLLPYGVDYDQDHVAVFKAGFAAARPIPSAQGKWLVPHVLTYEMTKLNWASEPLPRPVAYCDLSGGELHVKLQAVRLYATQLRPSPHIRSLESITALATVRGAEIGVTYAEAFGVLRTVV